MNYLTELEIQEIESRVTPINKMKDNIFRTLGADTVKDIKKKEDVIVEEKITQWSDTNIEDQRAKEFINNIKADYLRSIVRKHFEHECYFKFYTLKHFRKDFIDYLKDKERKYYFLPGLNNHYEDILKMLLKIKDEEIK